MRDAVVAVEGGWSKVSKKKNQSIEKNTPPTHPPSLHPTTGHVWYTTLDKYVFPDAPTSTRAVVTKTALDQLLWAPAFSCVFFAFINILDGRPDAVLPAIQAKLLPMLLANYALWPAAHLINFKFVPSRQRILYINCVQILWSAYLSHLSAGALRSAGRF